jgi:hypothetical protein
VKNEAQASINTLNGLLIKGNEERDDKKDIGKHEVFMYPYANARVLNILIIFLHIRVLSF